MEYQWSVMWTHAKHTWLQEHPAKWCDRQAWRFTNHTVPILNVQTIATWKLCTANNAVKIKWPNFKYKPITAKSSKLSHWIIQALIILSDKKINTSLSNSWLISYACITILFASISGILIQLNILEHYLLQKLGIFLRTYFFTPL